MGSRLFFAFSLSALAFTGCSSDSDKQQSLQEQDGSVDSGVVDPDAGPDAGSDASPDSNSPITTESVLGIWEKRKAGTDMIVSDTCGNFYLIDFDYQRVRLSKSGSEKLQMSYCIDTGCTSLDSMTREFNFAGTEALYDKKSEIVVDSQCKISMTETGRIGFVSSSFAKYNWTASLTYIGAGCAQIKNPKTVGDTCQSIAESEMDKVP